MEIKVLPFIAALKEKDEKHYEILKSLQDLVYEPSCIDMKTKLMICLAVDVAMGADNGVKNIANLLRNLGTTDDEIAEILRLTYFTKGNSVLHTSLAAFE